MDAWGKLFDIATALPGATATIRPDPDDAGQVTLTWPDGSGAVFAFTAGAWLADARLWRHALGGSMAKAAVVAIARKRARAASAAFQAAADDLLGQEGE
jgi:hypothetical protein